MKKPNYGKIEKYDSVRHPYLGDGEVTRILRSLKGIPIYAMVLFDRDPPNDYNLGTNPALEELIKLKKI